MVAGGSHQEVFFTSLPPPPGRAQAEALTDQAQEAGPSATPRPRSLLGQCRLLTQAPPGPDRDSARCCVSPQALGVPPSSPPPQTQALSAARVPTGTWRHPSPAPRPRRPSPCSWPTPSPAHQPGIRAPVNGRPSGCCQRFHSRVHSAQPHALDLAGQVGLSGLDSGEAGVALSTGSRTGHSKASQPSSVARRQAGGPVPLGGTAPSAHDQSVRRPEGVTAWTLHPSPLCFPATALE